MTKGNCKEKACRLTSALSLLPPGCWDVSCSSLPLLSPMMDGNDDPKQPFPPLRCRCRLSVMVSETDLHFLFMAEDASRTVHSHFGYSWNAFGRSIFKCFFSFHSCFYCLLLWSCLVVSSFLSWVHFLFYIFFPCYITLWLIIAFPCFVYNCCICYLLVY